MSETITFPAQLRERAGKGAARATRRAGQVPCVIYGNGKQAMPISIETRLMKRELAGASFFNQIYQIDVGGEKEQVLARDVQMHPIKDEPLHVDFLRVSGDSKISVAVPVRFVGEEESVGLRRGGVLNVVRYDVDVECAPAAIPDFIEIDLAEADIGDSLHISSVKLPEGVTPLIRDRDFTIATIVAPSAVKAEASEAEEEAEAEEEVEEEEKEEG